MSWAQMARSLSLAFYKSLSLANDMLSKCWVLVDISYFFYYIEHILEYAE
jgi:hypothetical protein